MGRPGAGERLCKLHSLEFGTRELRPGGSIRCGRHRDNDMQMTDTMVSRFHARFTWDKEMDRPVVFDNGSQNGTQVDGETVRNATPLRDGARVSIGPFVVKVELLGCADIPALIKDTGDMVTLFSDDGPDLEGKIPSSEALRELMLQLERERRTGTLKMKLKVGKAEASKAVVTYCLGRIMAAEIKDGKGLRALERILLSAGGAYAFSRELEPREDALNMWVSDYLRSRNLDPADKTQKFKPTQKIRRRT
jgi:pSer/pThr/pTyr-binding forkhead associated (FHA) protein